MPALSNHKHERFAQYLAKGMSAVKAYEEAGYKPNRQSASRLLTNVNIKERVAQLQELGSKRAEMTVESHLEKLQELRDKALEAGQHSAAIQAEQLRGKVSGYYVDRVEATHHEVTDEPMTPEEWQGQYSKPH